MAAIGKKARAAPIGDRSCGKAHPLRRQMVSLHKPGVGQPHSFPIETQKHLSLPAAEYG